MDWEDQKRSDDELQVAHCTWEGSSDNDLLPKKNKPKSTRNKSAAMEFVGVEQNSSDEDLLLSSQVARHAESNASRENLEQAGQEPHLANLELNDLRLANALQTMEGKTGPKDASKYAKRGMCKKRIAKSLATTCGCHMPCSVKAL